MHVIGQQTYLLGRCAQKVCPAAIDGFAGQSGHRCHLVGLLTVRVPVIVSIVRT